MNKQDLLDALAEEMQGSPRTRRQNKAVAAIFTILFILALMFLIWGRKNGIL